jgi:hypothetical protein
MYQSIPLDFRSRNMHNKNNKIDQYNKQFSNNVRVVDQDYRIPIKKQLGDNLYNMMLNDERDITSGCDNLYANTNIFNNYIQNNRIDYKKPDNLFADYSNKSSRPKNIYNTIINNTYNINNVTDVQNSATVHSSPIIKPVIITVSKEYIFKSNEEYSKYVDSSFINKVF